MEFERRITTLDQLNLAAKEMLAVFESKKIFLFNAQMGVGKTTFIKELCRALGSKDNLSSPTYSIINEYSSPSGKIYHFDLYRIKNIEELYDLGIEDYLYSNSFCFIEWPDLVTSLLNRDEYVSVNMSEINGERLISAN